MTTLTDLTDLEALRQKYLDADAHLDDGDEATAMLAYERAKGAFDDAARNYDFGKLAREVEQLRAGRLLLARALLSKLYNPMEAMAATALAEQLTAKDTP